MDDQKQNPQLNTNDQDKPLDEVSTQPEPQTNDQPASDQVVTDVQSADSLTEDQTTTESQKAELETTEENSSSQEQPAEVPVEEEKAEVAAKPLAEQESEQAVADQQKPSVPGARWYVVHTYSGHENRVAAAIKQRVESEHLEHKILDVLVPTQDKIEIRSGKKETVKEKIFPGYILIRMLLDDSSWLSVRTTQGVTSFIGMNNKPTPIPDSEVSSIVKFMEQGGQPTYKTVYGEGDTVKIVDGPFSEFIGKVETVDKEKGKIRVLVSIFGRETPVELDFLQVAKL